MRKFSFALRLINTEKEFVKTHAQEANTEMEKLYLLQTHSRQLTIINTMAIAIVLLVLIIYIKTCLNR